MPYRRLCAFILVATLSFFPLYAASQEEPVPPSCRVGSFSSSGRTSPFSTASSDTPPSSPGSATRPLSTVPPVPWTMDETSRWIAALSANKKIWPTFFAILSTLSCPAPSVDVKQHPHLKGYASPRVQGATLQTHAFPPRHLTHAGLIRQVINDGTLLKALKEARDPLFFPLIKKLSSPIRI